MPCWVNVLCCFALFDFSWLAFLRSLIYVYWFARWFCLFRCSFVLLEGERRRFGQELDWHFNSSETVHLYIKPSGAPWNNHGPERVGSVASKSANRWEGLAEAQPPIARFFVLGGWEGVGEMFSFRMCLHACFLCV